VSGIQFDDAVDGPSTDSAEFLARDHDAPLLGPIVAIPLIEGAPERTHPARQKTLKLV